MHLRRHFFCQRETLFLQQQHQPTAPSLRLRLTRASTAAVGSSFPSWASSCKPCVTHQHNLSCHSSVWHFKAVRQGVANVHAVYCGQKGQLLRAGRTTSLMYTHSTVAAPRVTLFERKPEARRMLTQPATQLYVHLQGRLPYSPKLSKRYFDYPNCHPQAVVYTIYNQGWIVGCSEVRLSTRESSHWRCVQLVPAVLLLCVSRNIVLCLCLEAFPRGLTLRTSGTQQLSIRACWRWNQPLCHVDCALLATTQTQIHPENRRKTEDGRNG